MNFSNNWRVKRNMEIKTPFFTPIANYYTDIQNKNELKESYTEKMLLNNFHLIPDPLKKNLADTIITNTTMSNRESKTPQNNIKTKEAPETSKTEYYPSLAGITNFFSGVFNVISGAVFHKRSQSPDTYYYDCFDSIDERERSPSRSWQTANMGDQNKIGEACDQFTCRQDCDSLIKLSEMTDCRSAVVQCEDKLKRVQSLLANPSKPSPSSSKYRSRRPRKVFVEPGSVLDSFEDAISSENFVSIPNDPRIQYYSPPQYHKPELFENNSPKIKTEMKTVPKLIESQQNGPMEDIPVITSSHDTKLGDNTIKLTTEDEIVCSPTSTADTKQQLISSCEDKLSRLKAILQERRKKNTKATVALPDSDSEPDKEMTKQSKKSESITVQKPLEKRLRNPQRSSADRRKKTKMRCNIQEDLLFAQEIEIEESSSIESSPSIHTFNKSELSESPSCKLNSCPKLVSLVRDPSKAEDEMEYFDEVVGRFRSTSTTDSEDSFQIVFNDSPRRSRKPSDCDSEDSFIVFEDSPDSCYTSNEVFGETDESEDESDTDSDLSDSGCNLTCQMSVLSKTLGDLTDDSLYEDRDVTDFAASVMCEELPEEEVSAVPEKQTGLLLNAEKKLRRRDLPPKKVQFSSEPPKVHVMRVWAYAARQARAGHWEKYVLDRDRFKRRIADVDMAVSWVLKPQHRSRVMFQRFMPWWNQQKRKELAEKKEREETQKEEERLKIQQQTHSIETQTEVIESQNPYESSKKTVDSNSIETDTMKIESQKKCVDLRKDQTEPVTEPGLHDKGMNNTEDSKTNATELRIGVGEKK